MQKNILKKGLKLLGSAFFVGYMALALSKPVHAKEQPKKQSDKFSLQVVTGYLSSSYCNIGPKTPELSYIQTNIRIGKKLKSFKKSNLEAHVEFSNSKVHKGFGKYFIGTTFLLRYNLVPLDCKIIPYAQIGFGGVYTDAYKDHSQNVIGESLEFNPKASLGFRYPVGKNQSIDAELMYEHLSNGSSVFNHTDRNVGANSFGAFVGFTYSF